MTTAGKATGLWSDRWALLPFVCPLVFIFCLLVAVRTIGIGQPALEISDVMQDAREALAANRAAEPPASDAAGTWQERSTRTVYVAGERVWRLYLLLALFLTLVAVAAAVATGISVTRAGPVRFGSKRSWPMVLSFGVIVGWSAISFFVLELSVSPVGTQFLDAMARSVAWADVRPFDDLVKADIITFANWYYFCVWTATAFVTVGMVSTLFAPSRQGRLTDLRRRLARQRYLLYAQSGILIAELFVMVCARTWALAPLMQDLTDLGPAGEGPKAALSELVRTEATFIGGLHTLELLVFYVPAMVITRFRAYTLVEATGVENPRQVLKDELADSSVRVRAAQIGTALAPLLASLLGPLVFG